MSQPPRIVIPPEAVRGRTILVDRPDALRRLVRVLRVRAGDAVECVDGAGRRYLGAVASAGPRGVTVAIERETTEPAAPLAVTLAPALLKPDRFDWVIQKATELGVREIIPLFTRRTTARLAPDRADAKIARWARIAREAAQQCGRATVPAIAAPQPLADALRVLGRCACMVMPTLAVPAPPLRELAEVVREAATAAVLIGPEGDFTPDEVALASRQGARPVSLGRATLRAETAALVVPALLHYMKDEGPGERQARPRPV